MKLYTMGEDKMRKALAVVVFLALMCGGAWADVDGKNSLNWRNVS